MTPNKEFTEFHVERGAAVDSSFSLGECHHLLRSCQILGSRSLLWLPEVLGHRTATFFSGVLG